jgi:hypothetical protein
MRAKPFIVVGKPTTMNGFDMEMEDRAARKSSG